MSVVECRLECHCRGTLRLALSLASNVASSGTLEARRLLQSCKEGSRATLFTDHGTNFTDHLYYRVVARFRGRRAVGMLVVETIGRKDVICRFSRVSGVFELETFANARAAPCDSRSTF